MQVRNQPDVLRTKSQRWELRPGHLPHAVHLRRGRAPGAVGEFAPPAAPGQENNPSSRADIWRLRVSCFDRHSQRCDFFLPLQRFFTRLLEIEYRIQFGLSIYVNIARSNTSDGSRRQSE